ncbi:hypothetical protein [Streptomyces sp. NBC_01296]|uniref:hypothetical protein n=1 Tax=Streptomyces sp. NBC_01296 TaxID=2903816 RepID=UPI002E0D4124|nr:hypothetical protein OG299_42475 [Streptomyces sp. NBC_01296]
MRTGSASNRGGGRERSLPHLRIVLAEDHCASLECRPRRTCGSQILRRADTVLDIPAGDVRERSQPVQQFRAQRPPPTRPGLPPAFGESALIAKKGGDDQGCRGATEERQ